MILTVPFALTLSGCLWKGIDTDRDTPDTADTEDSVPEDTTETDSAPLTDPVAVCTVGPDDHGLLSDLPTVMLYGEDSFDPEGHAITTHIWTITAAPEGSDASLTPGALESGRNLIPEMIGAYTFTLIAEADDGRRSAPCEVTYTLQGPPDGLAIQLVWEHVGDDLDLHLLAPGGSPAHGTLDCYYAHTAPDWGPAGPDNDPVMVADDIPGTGPETIVYPAPVPGTYRVLVHDYPGSVFNSVNPAQIAITSRGVTTTLSRDAAIEGEYYEIAEIEWLSGVVTECPDTGCE